VLRAAADQLVLVVMVVRMALLKMTVAMVVLAVLVEFIMPLDQLRHTQVVGAVQVKLSQGEQEAVVWAVQEPMDLVLLAGIHVEAMA